MRSRLGGLLVASCALAACEPAGPPPYGFDRLAEQRFRLETRTDMLVDTEPARVERLVELRLRALGLEGGGIELELYLDRYYERVERDSGEEEVAISPHGVVVRRAAEELRLGPDDRTPTASSVGALLARPAAGVALDPRGRAGDPWRSQDPLLAELAPLEWLLLCLPQLGAEAPAWSGRRRVPQLGRYRLGLELPLHYELGEGGGVVVRGHARRSKLRLDAGLEGALELDLRGRAELDPDGRVRGSVVDLELRFNAGEGGSIRAVHRLRLACRDCEAAFNSPAEAPDHRGE